METIRFYRFNNYKAPSQDCPCSLLVRGEESRGKNLTWNRFLERLKEEEVIYDLLCGKL